MTPEPAAGRHRTFSVLIAAAVGLGAVGFLTGTGSTPQRGGYRPVAPASVQTVATAPRQRDMESLRYTARRAEQQAALRAMATPPRQIDASIEIEPAAYASAVADRAIGRAYDGAPPTIPHAVEQQDAPACLNCHAEGLVVEGKIAKVLSHPRYDNCLQCHVTREQPLTTASLLPASVSETSAFVGLASAGHGERAWPGAPPQMPHRSFMRERCTSCHGVWATGLASSHPWRQSCTQCHAPSASADQAPTASVHRQAKP